MPSFDHDAVVVYLLVLLSFLVLVFLVFMWMIDRSARRIAQAYSSGPVQRITTWAPRRGKFKPLFYQQPERWVAVRSVDVGFVQEALGLSNTARCSWQESLARGGERAVFLTPPVMGWVLAIGPGLPDPVEDVDECYHFLVQLSRSVGEIQYFSVHPVLQHHAWARLSGGEVLRAYAWAGETMWDQGAVSRAESDLQMKCFAYGDTTATMLTAIDDAAGNVEKLPALAARWSINPAGIDERILEHGRGIAGESPRVRSS